MMKQKIYILGLTTALIVFLGTLFKVNHWPGAGYLLLAGIFILVFVFLPLALVNSFKAEGNKGNRLLYVVTWLTALVLFISILFKVQHWAGAGFLMLVAIPFPFLVFLPVFLLVTSRNKEHNIYTTVYMLFFLMIISCFTVLLALNVSKEKIVDSFGIVRNYYLTDKAVDNLTSQQQSPVDKKINELIVLTEEYEDSYLTGSLGVMPDMWKDDLGVFQDSWLSLKLTGRIDKQTDAAHFKLLSGLSEFISLLENTRGYESLAVIVPSVFNLRKTPGGNYNWDSDLILAPFHPWLLVYLEGLKTNLKMMRVTAVGPNAFAPSGAF